MDLKCIMCNKDFDEFERLPRVIPQCGHSYCDKCIKKALKQRKNLFVCPIDQQSHIFRRQNEQLPRNFAIINALRQKKSQSISKSRQKIALKKYEDDIKNSSLICQQHQKPIEFVCIDDNQSICSHCALFGAHRNHKLDKLSKPRVNKNLNDLLNTALLRMDSLSDHAQSITQSPNVLIKSFENLKRTLRNSIKQAFKSYHQTINRRQLYVEKQLDEIIKTWQEQSQDIQQRISKSHKDLVGLKQHLNLLDSENQETNRDSEVLAIEIEEIIQRVTQTQKDITKINQQIGIKTREYESQYKRKLQGSKFFKLQQLAVDMTGNKSQNSRSKSRQDPDLSYSIKVRPPSFSINASRQQKSKNMIPPKYQTATNLNNSNKFGSTAKSRLITTHSEAGDFLPKSQHKQQFSIDIPSSRKNSPSPSPIQKQKQERRASGRVEVRKKVKTILQLINNVQGSSLQLLGLQIKDYYLQQIFDFIIKSGKKFGLIKFVKNEITDEGFGIILQSVQNYQFLHTLNLTSNQLTQASLDKILQFSSKNKVLKNFYLRNNLINAQKTKDKKKQMFDKGLNIFY